MKKTYLLLTVLLLTIILSACGQNNTSNGSKQAAASVDKVYKFNLAHPFPEGLGVVSDWEKYFVEEVEKRANGRVDIEIYWSESLGKQADLADLVKSGGVDMAAIVPTYTPSIFPLAAVTNEMGYVNQTQDEAIAVANKLHTEGPIAEEIKNQNMEYLYVHVIPSYQLWSTKPVETLEDLKGLKVRTYGPYLPIVAKETGAVGVQLLQSEWFEAVQKGLAEGGFFANSMALASKIDEITQYVSNFEYGFTSGPVLVVNQDKWNNLPEDLQAIFKEVAAELTTKGLEINDQAEAAALIEMEEKGITVVEFKDKQKMLDLLPDFQQVWVDKQTESGLGEKAQEVVGIWNRTLEEVRNQ